MRVGGSDARMREARRVSVRAARVQAIRRRGDEPQDVVPRVRICGPGGAQGHRAVAAAGARVYIHGTRPEAFPRGGGVHGDVNSNCT